MNFFKWIIELPGTIRVMIVLSIFIINCLTSLLIARNIDKLYDRTKSPEKALHRMRLLSQYVQGVLMAVSGFFIVLMILPFSKPYGKPAEALSLVIVALIFIIMILIMQAIYYKTQKKIRGTTESAKENLSKTFKAVLITILPMILVFVIFALLPNEIKDKAFSSVSGLFLIMLFVILINLIMPLFYKSMLKAVPMESSELKEKLIALLYKADLKNTVIYSWPTIKSKQANALVSGFKQKSVYISDYLIENCSYDEVEAILAHEIGHIKKYHLWIRMALTIIPVPLFAAIGNGMEYYEKYYHTSIPVLPGIIGMVILLIVYFRLIFLLFTRTQERQADAFVLKVGIDPNVYISALLKLAKLNNMSTKLNKLDEKFQTHPSIARRISWVEKEAGITYEASNNIDPNF